MLKKLYLFVPIFLISLILIASLTPIVSAGESISKKVFRLHIIANSNEKYDQDLKLKVKDSVLEYTKDLYNGCKNVNDALEISKRNLSSIEEAAQKTVSFYGYGYDTIVYTSKEFFNTRKYDSFTLPAGEYYCLKIIIGEGKGKNWWCVLFPSVCISGCTDDFDGVLTEEERKLTEGHKYVVKFKAAELYEYLKSKRR